MSVIITFAARSEQLQHALDSRVIIEQAKGILAASIGLDVDIAFMVLRHHARSHNQQLTSVAHAIVAGDLTAEAVAREIPRPPEPVNSPRGITRRDGAS